MFAHIIPHSTSFSTEPLTYFVGDSFRSEISIWQLVEIPYGKKTIFGVVAKIFHENATDLLAENPERNIEIKEISALISPAPLLDEYQITMILRLSKKYIITIHRILSIFLFSSLISRLEKYNFPLISGEKSSEKITQNEIFIAKDDIISPEKILPYMRENIVIILPDDIILDTFKKFFEKNLEWSEKIFFFPSDTTDTRRAQAWIDIYNKKFPIIIWTRRLISYNMSRYYQYPVRLQYIDFLAHIADSEQFSLKIFTSIPRLKTLSQFHYFSLTHI